MWTGDDRFQLRVLPFLSHLPPTHILPSTDVDRVPRLLIRIYQPDVENFAPYIVDELVSYILMLN